MPAIFAAGHQNDVPLLAGGNRDEGSFAVSNPAQKPTAASFKEQAEKEFSAKADDFLRLYPADTEEHAFRSAEDYAGDRFIALSTWKWLEAQRATGKQPVYRYRFDLALPRDSKRPGGESAFHSAEIEYVFGNLDSRKGATFRPEDYKLSDLMQTFWTNFARSGDPNGTGVPNWPTYGPAGNWQVMRLSPDPGAAPDQHRDRYLFLQQVWGDQRAESATE